MRATIDLPDDLHQAVTSIAAYSRKSMSQTVVKLIRRGLQCFRAASRAQLGRVLRDDPPLVTPPASLSSSSVNSRSICAFRRNLSAA